MGYYCFTDKEAGLLLGSGGPIVGTYTDDTFDLTITNTKDQLHPYGEWGNDTYNLVFSDIHGFAHGHHVTSDHFSNVDYSDTFDFINVDEVHSGGVVVGRLEDYDNTRDILKIEGKILNLDTLDTFYHPNVTSVRLVGFMGSHNDHSQAMQQWLLIETAKGGKIFYAIGGARIDMNDDGMSNGHQHEGHFLQEYQLPDFDALHDMRFYDDHNVVPSGYSTSNGVVYNDHDKATSDVRNLIGDEAHEATEFGDLIAAGLNDDTVMAKAGNDRVWGGSGNDKIFGGSGDDFIYGGSGDDIINGGPGRDFIFGGPGSDTLSYSSAESDVQIDLSTLCAEGDAYGDYIESIENIIGGRFSDTLKGTNESNRLAGGCGNDFLVGRGGADSLYGDLGSDRLHGGSGNDKLVGGSGQDRLWGGYGNDTLYGGSGDDRLAGNEGNDKLYGGKGRDSIWGGSGDDRVSGGSGNDRLVGKAGDDKVWGGGGWDKLWGGFGDDMLSGGYGNDQLFGRSGNDKLYGGRGHDHLWGGSGHDHLNGGEGGDVLIGGPGSDTFIFKHDSGRDIIRDFEPDYDDIDLRSAHEINGWRDLTKNHMRLYHHDVIIEYGSNEIVIEDTLWFELDASDFLF